MPRLGSEMQATAAAAPATARVARDLPPSLAQAHPEDQNELANLFDKVTGHRFRAPRLPRGHGALVAVPT